MFYESPNLTSINIPNSITSIPHSFFQGCKSLTNITIPKSITGIGSQAFVGCFSLKTIICNPTTAPQVTNNPFGASNASYTGRYTYNTGENMLYVPTSATGYDTRYWLDPLQNAEKCGFSISYSL
jgi:hypothetical protein